MKKTGAQKQREAVNFAQPNLATRPAFGEGALTAKVSYSFGK